MTRAGPNRLVSSMVDNLGNILLRSAAFGMLVLSKAYTFITGNFDLSVESSLGLTAMFAALLLVTTEAG